MKTVFKISILLAVLTITLQACSKKNDPSGDDSGTTGQIEFNGNKYAIDEGSVIISGNSAPYDYMLSLDKKDGGNGVVFVLKGSSGTELPAGTYTMDSESMTTFPLYTLEGDLSSLELTYYISDASLDVQKSGSKYNITFTGTTTNISGSKQYSFKLTYSGTVEVIKL